MNSPVTKDGSAAEKVTRQRVTFRGAVSSLVHEQNLDVRCSSTAWLMTGANPYADLMFREANGKRMAYLDEGQGDAVTADRKGSSQ